MARASALRWFLVTLLVLQIGATPSLTIAMHAAAQAGNVAIGSRGDAGNSGAMPGTGPAEAPSIRWDSEASGIVMGMAIRDEMLYFATKDPGQITALDRASGTVAWTVDLGGESTVFGPEVAGDLVVVGLWGAGGNAVVALDAGTGAERWRVATVNLPTAPTHVDGTIYVAAEGGLDAESGLYALDAATGAEKWVFAAPEALDLGERVAVSDGVVVAVAWSLEDNGVGAYALDAATGQVLWTFTEADELNMEPVAGNGVVLLSDLPRTWALDLRSGAILWEHSGQSTGGGQAMDATNAYLSYGDQVEAVSLQGGTPLWSAPVSGIAGAPVVAGGRVYTAVWTRSDDLSNHWIHAFDAATGAEVWAIELEEHSVDGNQPLAHDGVLYVDTNSGVVAFGGTSPQGTTPATEAGAESAEYTSPEFGHVISWSTPWHLSEPQSSTEPGRDFVTLVTGDAKLVLSSTSRLTSAEEMIRFYVSDLNTTRPDMDVIEVVEGRELSSATARFTIDNTSYIEYIEVRPLRGGNGIFLTILTAPADWFALAWQATQQLATVDQQPPFRAAPDTGG